MQALKQRLIDRYPDIMDSIKASAIRREQSQYSHEQLEDHILCELGEMFHEYFKGGLSDKFYLELSDVIICCLSGEIFGVIPQTNIPTPAPTSIRGGIRKMFKMVTSSQTHFLLDYIALWVHGADWTDRVVMSVVHKVVLNESR